MKCNRHSQEYFKLFQFLTSRSINICLVSESGLNSNLFIRNNEFKIYRNDSINARRFVAIVIRKNISYQLLLIVNTSVLENIVIKLFINLGSIDINSCYYPGGSAGPDSVRKRQFASDIIGSVAKKKISFGWGFQ